MLLHEAKIAFLNNKWTLKRSQESVTTAAVATHKDNERAKLPIQNEINLQGLGKVISYARPVSNF